MKRVGFIWWEVLAWIAGLILIVMLVIPVTRGVRSTSPPPPCFHNLRVVSLALSQYTQDFNQRLPPIGRISKSSPRQSQGWANALWSYHRDSRAYKCPQGYTEVYGRTDYWFNSNLSRYNVKDLPRSIPKAAQNILVFGDGNDTTFETTSTYNLNSLPATWINDPKSPAYRHEGMANYAFLDGHVKALPPQQITNEPLANGKPTFAVK